MCWSTFSCSAVGFSIGGQYRRYTPLRMTRHPTSTYAHWIDGRAVAGTSGRIGEVFNPSLGAVASRVALASESEVDAAVRAARAAFPAWAATPPLKRA